MRARAHRHTSAKPGSAGCLERLSRHQLNLSGWLCQIPQQDLADQIQSVYPGESLVLTPAAHCFRSLRHPKRADTRDCVSLARNPRVRLQSRALLNYEPLVVEGHKMPQHP